VAAETIFRKGKNAVFLLLTESSPPTAERAYRRIAEANKEQLFFCYSMEGQLPELHERLIEYLGANFVELPAVFIVEPMGQAIYHFKGEISSETALQEFLNDYNAHAVQRFTKSEPVVVSDDIV
jgi:hypothetical protein